MRKNSGVSMISLVITIIVIIILAAVAFGSSTDTIENANFSNFTNNVSEVQGLLDQQAVTLKGNEGKEGVSRTDAQVYNYIAKGATLVDESGENWLSRADANEMTCTQLKAADMEKVIDYALPAIKVSTANSNGVNCSYFVTNEGKVFVWPPYIYENELYVNGDTKIPGATPESGEVYPTTGGTFNFKVGNTTIYLSASAAPADQAAVNTLMSGTDATKQYTIYYTDGTNVSPVGAESTALYKLAAQ